MLPIVPPIVSPILKTKTHLFLIFSTSPQHPNSSVVDADQGRVSWDPVVTMDFMATLMDVLQVERPASQQKWHFDGTSIMSILKNTKVEQRGIGWMYHNHIQSTANGYAYRYGQWKYVAGGVSCNAVHSTFNCSRPQLYDMSNDYAEEFDVSLQFPLVFRAIEKNFTTWYESIQDSWENESQCGGSGGGSMLGAFPRASTYAASDRCLFDVGSGLHGRDIAVGSVASRELCCGACSVVQECVASDYVVASRMRPTFEGIVTGGTCHLKREFDPKMFKTGELQVACRQPF